LSFLTLDIRAIAAFSLTSAAEHSLRRLELGETERPSSNRDVLDANDRGGVNSMKDRSNIDNNSRHNGKSSTGGGGGGGGGEDSDFLGLRGFKFCTSWPLWHPEIALL
jgi:hypothetical protein